MLELICNKYDNRLPELILGEDTNRIAWANL